MHTKKWHSLKEILHKDHNLYRKITRQVNIDRVYIYLFTCISCICSKENKKNFKILCIFMVSIQPILTKKMLKIFKNSFQLSWISFISYQSAYKILYLLKYL